MQREKADKIVSEITQEQSFVYRDFLSADPSDKVSILLERLTALANYQKEMRITENPMKRPVSDILREIKTFDESQLTYLDNCIAEDLKYFLVDACEVIVHLSLLRALSNLWFEKLEKDYRLSPKLINQAILQTLEGNFFETKRGGDRSDLDEPTKLKFLALCNRFNIVIKNARSDFKKLKKEKFSDSKAKEEIIKNYDIPKDLLPETFNNRQQPAELALEWAERETKTKLALKTLKDLKTKIAKEFSLISKGKIVDVDYSKYGRRIYAITYWNKDQIGLLKYSPLKKSKRFLDNDLFLVESSFF